MKSSSMLTRFLAVLVIVAPVLLATIAATVMRMEPADAWSTKDEPSGAPAAASPAGYSDADLLAARRAASNAGTQSGFLNSGVKELSDGSRQLAEGTTQLRDGIAAAHSGSGELSAGMVQLQAGVGQMGPGAQELADGIEQVAGALVGVEASRGQLLAALDQIDKELEESVDPRSEELREQLNEYRPQLENITLSEEQKAQFTRMREGSRELANQLNTPGYAFHDGIFQATQGAKDLNQGLAELERGSVRAQEGATALADGAERVEKMAEDNKNSITGIQRALPAHSAQTDPTAVSEAPTNALPPLYALLIAALAMGLGAAVGLARLSLLQQLVAAVGIAASAAVALAIVGDLGVLALALSAGLLLLATIAGSAIAQLVQLLLPQRFAPGVVGAVFLLQLLVVGLVWKSATTGTVELEAQIATGLMPLHYATAGLSAIGNSAHGVMAGSSAAVLAIMAAGGLWLARHQSPRPSPSSAEPAAGREDGVDKPAATEHVAQ
ncbi:MULTISPECIES: YhgE/Pip domain-containing protein [Corynebacterium]|uniref:YhgE/Pip domain-containing protein n=1 Tax=Corynebacterium TaxID=1716 RepID=UPI00124D2D59|nr:MULTISPECIES: YhgE/Pip domain-containing protein [Corynebacterium]